MISLVVGEGIVVVEVLLSMVLLTFFALSMRGVEVVMISFLPVMVFLTFIHSGVVGVVVLSLVPLLVLSTFMIGEGETGMIVVVVVESSILVPGLVAYRGCTVVVVELFQLVPRSVFFT